MIEPHLLQAIDIDTAHRREAHGIEAVVLNLRLSLFLTRHQGKGIAVVAEDQMSGTFGAGGDIDTEYRVADVEQVGGLTTAEQGRRQAKQQ
ncbi:MAG: hypothetical protein M3436_15720 [Pseudomonadota bacterium]|nr:hypothetical protein [Pseudomonadota bacterium]